MARPKWIVGIDEAGRGPLAGPVAVGAVMIPANFDIAFFEGLRDSKQLSHEAREAWFAKIKAHPEVRYAVSFGAPHMIDHLGMSAVIRKSIAGLLRRLAADPGEAMVLLDGLLKAPAQFSMQQTIIKGDETEPAISLASICAKVLRDRKMVAYAGKYPQYGFAVHKGYGTLAHRKAIAQYGVCEIHRVTYCKNIGWEARGKQ